MTDVQTGSLLGVKSTMDIIFGIAGSLLTDAIGVRKTAMAALCMATIGRMIFVLGRSSTALWIASLTFSPFGEAVLGTGIYTVALKKLTPPRLRPLAFAVQYASFNFSGALCDYVIDTLRMQVRFCAVFLLFFYCFYKTLRDTGRHNHLRGEILRLTDLHLHDVAGGSRRVSGRRVLGP